MIPGLFTEYFSEKGSRKKRTRSWNQANKKCSKVWAVLEFVPAVIMQHSFFPLLLSSYTAKWSLFHLRCNHNGEIWRPRSKYQQPGPQTEQGNSFMLRTVINLTSVSKTVIYLLTRSIPPLRDVALFNCRASWVSDLPDIGSSTGSAVLLWEERSMHLCWDALMFALESPYICTVEFIIFLSTESKPASHEKVFHGKNLKHPHETIKCDPRAHKSLNYSVCSSQIMLFWGLIFLAPLENYFPENQKLNNFRKPCF